MCVFVCVCVCVCNVFSTGLRGGGWVGGWGRKWPVAVYWRPSSMMVDYTDFEEKDWEREREKSFCMFYITCGPTTQREENFFFREKFLNFIIIKFCSKVFVVFVSAAVYWEIITIGVDYTDFERLRREKKGKCFPSSSSPAAAHHREKNY